MSITTDKTEQMKNASKTKELSEEDIRGYFKCNATEPKEKAPKKQIVKFAFDEILVVLRWLIPFVTCSMSPNKKA